MGIQLITGASAPLIAADLRLHCSIAPDDTTFDSLLTGYSAAATNLIEETLGLALGAQTWKLALGAFPDAITLPRGPVTAISWLKYYDTAGAEQTLSSASYLVDLVSDPQRIVPMPDINWPATQARANAVTVQFSTGYVTVPPMILQCIRATVAAWYMGREMAALPDGVTDALARWRTSWAFA